MGKEYQMTDAGAWGSFGTVILARNFDPEQRFQFQCSAPMSRQHPLI